MRISGSPKTGLVASGFVISNFPEYHRSTTAVLPSIATCVFSSIASLLLVRGEAASYADRAGVSRSGSPSMHIAVVTTVVPNTKLAGISIHPTVARPATLGGGTAMTCALAIPPWVKVNVPSASISTRSLQNCPTPVSVNPRAESTAMSSVAALVYTPAPTRKSSVLVVLILVFVLPTSRSGFERTASRRATRSPTSYFWFTPPPVTFALFGSAVMPMGPHSFRAASGGLELVFHLLEERDAALGVPLPLRAADVLLDDAHRRRQRLDPEHRRAIGLLHQKQLHDVGEVLYPLEPAPVLGQERLRQRLPKFIHGGEVVTLRAIHDLFLDEFAGRLRLPLGQLVANLLLLLAVQLRPLHGGPVGPLALLEHLRHEVRDADGRKLLGADMPPAVDGLLGMTAEIDDLRLDEREALHDHLGFEDDQPLTDQGLFFRSAFVRHTTLL